MSGPPLTVKMVAGAIRNRPFFEFNARVLFDAKVGYGRLYGQEIQKELWNSAMAMAARGFPRSDYEKERRMERFMEWKLKHRRLRAHRYARNLAIIFWGTPLAIVLTAGLWRTVWLAVLS